MSELLYKDMPKEKIINTLKELKATWHGKSPSKYYFALGHAIRLFEASASQQSVAPDEKAACRGHQFYALYSNIMQCKNCGKTISHR